MMLALLVPSLLAALTSASPTPDPAAPSMTPVSEAGAPDLFGPHNVFPYPLWMVWTAGILVAILLGVGIFYLVRWIRRRPGPPPPTPRQVALAELEKLRQQVGSIEPYPFSIAVSDVLRTFIGKVRSQLPATRQTSAEFLAAIAHWPQFTDEDRVMLGRFLGKCDMIKFARMDATKADNEELVESALAFVRGGLA